MFLWHFKPTPLRKMFSRKICLSKKNDFYKVVALSKFERKKTLKLKVIFKKIFTYTT